MPKMLHLLVNLDEVQGRTEFDIYKTFSSRTENLIRTFGEGLEENCKNDVKSDRIYKSASNQFLYKKKYYYYLEKYTKSLRYATYNRLQYSHALAQRATIFFVMQLYENCLIDIDLCLQANYPNYLRTDLYFQKMKCFAQMGKLEDMSQTLDAFKTFLSHSCDNIYTLGQQKEDLKNMTSIVKKVKSGDIQPGVSVEEISFAVDQVIEAPHAENASASSALSFQSGNGDNSDMVVTAARDIKRGEVLFVEKAYKIGIHYPLFDDVDDDDDGCGVFYCDCCSKEARNCVPCKTCIDVLYCSEECRDTAWSECHQWECKLFRSNFLDPGLYLSLRSVIKAASNGSINEIINEQPANIETPNQFLKIYKNFVDFDVLYRDQKAALSNACTASVYMVQALQSSKFFDFLMTTPYYTNTENIESLVPLIGGILLKHIIQSYQNSLVINRFSPRITSLNENEDNFKLLQMNIKCSAAFYPSISELPHSCFSNTTTSFQEDICTVKAFKDIKAGDLIYRSAYLVNPAYCKDLWQNVRIKLNKLILGLTCRCEACLNIKNTRENFNSFICPNCNGHATVDFEAELTNCVDCKVPIKLLEDDMLDFASWYGEDDLCNMYDTTIKRGLTFSKYVTYPYHIINQDLHKILMCLYRKSAEITEFLEALKNYQEIATERMNADPFEYLINLCVMCENCCQYLYYYNKKRPKPKVEELFNCLSNLIEETKEAISASFIEDQQLINMFIPADSFILQFKKMCN